MLPDTQSNNTIIWPDDNRPMVLIPAGDYPIGTDDGPEPARPRHVVRLADFYIDRWPVTNAEYKTFVDATSHALPHYDVPWCDSSGYNWDPETGMYPEGKAEHPVVLVTQDDALAYAAWANKRLPSEAEWEAAARGQDGRVFPWGNQFHVDHCNTTEAKIGGVSEVGYFSPQGDTPEGVVDMIGNVWEWTSSLFYPYPYLADDGREDPSGDRWQVLRGGSWMNHANVVSAYARLDADFLFYTNVGFRCAVSIK